MVSVNKSGCALGVVVRLGVFAVAALWTITAWAGGIEGRWYGEDYEQDPGVRTQWLNYRAADGTFSVEFRQYRNCQLEMRQIESGHWSLVGSVYTMVTEWVEFSLILPGEPHYTEVYDVVTLEARAMSYRHRRTGILFKARQVGPDFDFPACEPMS